jgi:hypothetical protein
MVPPLMSGGTISDNTTPQLGGGVYVAAFGTFTMNDGTISSNTAEAGGGGVTNDGTFTMNSGTISNNRVISSDIATWGGGVAVCNGDGTFTMNGGSISDNMVSSDIGTWGGGVAVLYGTFILSGGTISENTASSVSFSCGGGVYVIGSFTMSGGDISHNTADLGGGVCVEDGSSFDKSSTGGIIYGSDASSELKNTAASGDGHAVHFRGSPNKKRNTTVNTGDSLSTDNAAGWE